MLFFVSKLMESLQILNCKYYNFLKCDDFFVLDDLYTFDLLTFQNTSYLKIKYVADHEKMYLNNYVNMLCLISLHCSFRTSFYTQDIVLLFAQDNLTKIRTYVNVLMYFYLLMKSYQLLSWEVCPRSMLLHRSVAPPIQQDFAGALPVELIIQKHDDLFAAISRFAHVHGSLLEYRVSC